LASLARRAGRRRGNMAFGPQRRSLASVERLGSLGVCGLRAWRPQLARVPFGAKAGPQVQIPELLQERSEKQERAPM